MPDTPTPSATFTSRLITLARENPDQVRWISAVVSIFLLVYFLPAGTMRFDNAVLEGIRLTHWYAQEHVILCLLPSFVIAGAMAAYLSQGAVMRYLGPSAPKRVAFGIAIYAFKWHISALLAGLFALLLIRRWGWPLRQVTMLAGAVVLAALLAGPALSLPNMLVIRTIMGTQKTVV
ncbi:hypothetical protein [Halomonas korlensis]|uniref:Uncharacterized protein n=1 Tax=Halomonas korlensis TaxID=463301 RepID=A0A1I7FGF0_9GAMM|nr:hypothetical protein [Halomonas korlensis]SFU35260.1 hypothetical protein SAMN04487955_101468 [Halomonas korlensis]